MQSQGQSVKRESGEQTRQVADTAETGERKSQVFQIELQRPGSVTDLFGHIKTIQRSSTLPSSQRVRSPIELTSGIAPVATNESASDAKESLQRQWTETSTSTAKDKKYVIFHTRFPLGSQLRACRDDLV